MFLALFVGTIYLIVMITQAERRIPIQHVKKQVGMRQTGGSNFLPIKVNTAGVIPIIFAISMLLFPSQILAAIPGNDGFIADLKRWANYLTPSTQHWWSLLIYGLMIVGFTYFYTAVVMNVNDMADNLKKYGNFIPGIRPGRPTFEYLDRVVSRVTLAGAVFLAGVALIQYVAPGLTGVSLSSFALIGGTSLLIVVGVAIEVMQAIEAQLIMRNYEGFIKQSSKSPAGYYA
jgi:preprotein translocase subunit SecY